MGLDINKLPKEIREKLETNMHILDMKDYAGIKGCSKVLYQRSNNPGMWTSGFAEPGVSIEDRVGDQEIDWVIQIPVGGKLSEVKIQIYSK